MKSKKEEDEDITNIWASLRVGWAFFEKTDKVIGFNSDRT